MTELLTPKELDERGIMSLVKQWQERKAGKLQHYRVGKKILYSQAHIDAYLKGCEQSNTESEAKKDAA